MVHAYFEAQVDPDRNRTGALKRAAARKLQNVRLAISQVQTEAESLISWPSRSSPRTRKPWGFTGW